MPSYKRINGLLSITPISNTYIDESNIIKALTNERIRQNLTQSDLSKKTGITQADISRIESGIRNPSLEITIKLALGLGLELRLIYQHAGDE